MKKYVGLILALLFCYSLVNAQQQDRLQLISSSHSRIDGETGNMMNYRPVYEHKGSTLSADSGYVYTDELQREFFDAYGRVVITQPDGTIIYANKLNYAADPQLAVLTDQVKMVDGKSVLTTNYLTYNMKSSTGTYTGGGRIVNEADTITSKNAWYFNKTKDAYFRHDVIVRTPDVKIYTDTMRYNTGIKTSYFYGPTNIKGKDGENLYTEDGYYNTETELAEFYKNNLYTETSRFLKGDTLYYDGKTGNGRAIQHVVFIDTADQFFGEGALGLYNKNKESITLTGKPLITMVVKSDSTENKNESPTYPTVSEIPPTELSTDSTALSIEVPKQQQKVDSVYMTADTLYSQMIFLKDYIPKNFKLDREGGEIDTEEEFFEEVATPPDSSAANLVAEGLSTDSLNLEDKLLLDSLSSIDSLSSQVKIALNPVESSIIQQDLKADSILRQQVVIPTGLEADSLMSQAIESINSPENSFQLPQDSISSDTTKTRIIKAYRNVRVFKSDLQAVADSAYYGYPDSMMRFFGSPMAWTQGSQLNGDSLFIQIKNEKIDNMILENNAFIVNTRQDSVKYNQVKGKKVTGYFTNGELERIFVDGNSESLAYRENKTKTGYTEMHHNRSSRIKLLIRNNELTDFIPIRSTQGTIYPLHLVTQEQEILEGFVWKPGDRPVSKEDLLNRKRASTLEDAALPASPPPVMQEDSTANSMNPEQLIKEEEEEKPVEEKVEANQKNGQAIEITKNTAQSPTPRVFTSSEAIENKQRRLFSRRIS